MKLTSSHDIPIMIRPIAACFNMVNHSSYFLLSPAAVSILNQAHRAMINPISASNQSTQLIAVFIALIKPPAPSASFCPDFATHTPAAELVVFVNVLVPSVGTSKLFQPPPPCANAGAHTRVTLQIASQNHSIDLLNRLINFICFCYF